MDIKFVQPFTRVDDLEKHEVFIYSLSYFYKTFLLANCTTFEAVQIAIGTQLNGIYYYSGYTA